MCAKKQNKDLGGYITLNGERVVLSKHTNDFSLIGTAQIPVGDVDMVEPMAPNMTRVRVAHEEDLDEVMTQARTDAIAHHIYQIEDTEEEIVIRDQIIIELRMEGTGLLEEIIDAFALQYQGRLGDAHILQVTDASGRNPLKIANEIAELEGVDSSIPEVMLELEFHRAPALSAEQWYLASDMIEHVDILSGCDVQVADAWDMTIGDPDIVIAVIDDGFDLGHPALNGVQIHPQSWDFRMQDAHPNAEGQIGGDLHGTPVASIAIGTHEGSAMHGVAPGCTFMPIRVGFGLKIGQTDLHDVFRHVSQHADIVNCSFGLPPQSHDITHRALRKELTEFARTGGRRGKGLVIVFSAANHDAPTFLPAKKNKNGVRYVDMKKRTIREISKGHNVYSGFPTTEGVIVVGAMSSRKRKAGYSNWGPHLTVTAPSHNMHYITSFIRRGSDARRDLFEAHYRGLGMVAASNRPNHGAPFSPFRNEDDPQTSDWEENLYTKQFGGTSGAAPIVAGIAGLMLSVNPELTATEVRQILASTADRDLDPILDLKDDPNVQGITGEFVNGYSQYFGHGKVNASAAVARAYRLYTRLFVPTEQKVGPNRDLIVPKTFSLESVSQGNVYQFHRDGINLAETSANIMQSSPHAHNHAAEISADRIPTHDEYGMDDSADQIAPMLLPDVRSRIRWHPSPYHSGRGGFQPEAVVVHIAVGPFGAIRNWFQHPDARASAHYGVGKDGRIDQYVAEERAAWHAGNVLRPTWGLLKAGVNPNRYTIGIEHAGYADDPWTEVMYETSASLIRDICDRWNIPIDRNHIVGHREIYAAKTCPGSQVSIEKLITLALDGIMIEQPHEIGTQETYHIVKRGDTLFGIANLYNTTLSRLQQLNPEIADIDLIYIGQRVKVM